MFARAPRPRSLGVRQLNRLSVLFATFVLAACGGGSQSTTNATSTAVVRATAHATVGAAASVQYVRLQALSEVNGNAWASMAEFNLVDTSGATMSRSGWSVTVDSQETTGENAPATSAIDGDPNSFWHTQWYGASPPMPHTFTVKLGAPAQVGGFRYLPRQNGVNGRIGNYAFFTSSDGNTWTQVAQGAFANTASESTVLTSQGPTLAALSDRMDPVNKAVTQPVSATDPSGFTLSYSAIGLPTGLAIDPTSGSISGTPIAVGTFAVTIQVTDGRSSTSGAFTWTIASVGGAGITARYVRLEALSELAGNPWSSVAEFNVLDSGGAVMSRAGWSVTADSQETVGENAAASNAIDGDPNSFWHTQWYGGSPTPPHALTVNLGAVRSIGGFKYLPRQIGVNGRIAGYRFYTSTDGTTWSLVTSGVFPNSADETTVRLNAPTNHPPVLSAVSNRTDATGQPVTQPVLATDADGDALTYSAAGLPNGLAINATSGTISGTPTAAGSFAVSVTVGDGHNTASTSFTWVITATNHAPTLSPLAARSDVASQPVTQAVAAGDADGDPLAYSATGLPNGLSIAPSTGTISGTPTTVGSFAVNVTVGDGRATAATSFTWTITAANHAPVLAPLSGRTDVAGQSVSQAVSASDADGDRLAYSATGLPTGLVIDAATGTISGTPTAGGTFPVVVTVSDGRVGASTAFTWVITVNHAPVLAPLAGRSDVAGQPVTQAVSASDADGDRLTYSATGLPTGLVLNAATGTMSGTPTASGTFMVTVTVGDGRASAATAFTWTITTANRAPVLAPLSGRTDVAGQPVTQAVSASDADGDTLAYSATSLPTGLVISTANGTISGTPTAAGSFTVIVAVTDGRANASTSFTWVIAAANRAPVLAPPSNRTDVAGQSVTQSISASDADGDTLTYSAMGLPPGLAIGPSSGTIAGTPTVAGSYSAMVTVSDGRANASTLFTWVITAAPVASGGGITARFVRLEALSEINGNPWSSMAEFNLVDPNGATLSRSGWTVVADSQELVGENGAATNAIDGDPNSFWHTQWYGANPTPPHTFTVNLGGARLIGGFKYLPRQNGVNGRIANYRFYTSSDGTAWQLVTQGTFANDASEKTTRISSPTSVNQPPTLTGLPTTRTDTVGSALTLAVVARDPDGDTLTYSAAGLPTGLSINAASGLISGTASQANTFYPNVFVSDGRGGSATQSFNWVIASSTPTTPTPPTPPSTAPGASGVNPPIVFNASTSAVAGDVISLQGENFGSAPSVYFDGYPATPLTIVDSVGTGWLAVQIPTTATAALVLRIGNGTGISAQIKLNAARPYHLDTTELHPGTAFRLFGRNLKAAGSNPTVTVNGAAASIDLANSTDHMLLVTAPAVAASSTATVVVDNGNGSGSAPLDRTASVVSSGSGDPFALGVGWGASFSTIASRTIYPANDSRIGDKALCNGSHDDGGAIQQAIDLAAASGGAVVQLPAGRCSYSSIITLRSNVVVRGAGKTSTELYHTVANYPAIGQGVDLAGMSDLTLSNSQDGDSMLFKNSTRIFLKNVKINIGTSKQMYLDGNVNFVFASSDVVQTGNSNQQGPYTLDNDRGLVFEGNTTTWVSGAPTFGKIHDASIRSSRFTRNATNQNTPGAVHSLTLDFAYRVSVIGNAFDTIGGPVTNTTRNDGETILTEGGGANRTENNGKVGSATATTITDPTNTLNVDPFGYGYIPEDLGIAIVSGKGAGQMRHIVSYSSATRTATVDHAWDSIPDSTSRYATSVFGLEQGLIEGNTLSQGPRGIWLYNTSMRDVDVIGNVISEGGGIYVRSYQNLSTGYFNAIYGVLIKGNQISNTTRNWMSYINVVFTNGDGIAFGTGTIGIEIRNNVLTANRPNVYSLQEEYAGTEGFTARMPLESGGYFESSTIPRLLGTVFDGNTCNYCDVGVRIGTGSAGTVINNTKLLGTPSLYTDTSTVSTGEKATATVVR